ncbi:MAG: MoaD/ThiS family protein [Gemmatimonadales bacterium]
MPAAAASSVTVRVLLFASYAERLGLESVELSLPSPATVGGVLARLRTMPGGAGLPPHPLCARNLAHVSLDEPVSPGDEIAVLPPLAGG